METIPSIGKQQPATELCYSWHTLRMWADMLLWAWVKTSNPLLFSWDLSLSDLSLKNSLRNNHLRQSSAQLACWLPTLSEIAFKGFHMFANQLLLTCVKFPSLLLPSHFVHKNTRLLILESTDAFWTFASGLLLLQVSPREVTHNSNAVCRNYLEKASCENHRKWEKLNFGGCCSYARQLAFLSFFRELPSNWQMLECCSQLTSGSNPPCALLKVLPL